MKYLLKQGLSWCMLSMAVSASAQVSTPVASTQLPTGGKVMSGTTSIQSSGNVLNINQSSQRSAINWNTFNVGSGAKVNFIQPSASSVTLNRVLDTNGSQILGNINANGQVFISNPNGVLFGPNSQVNVGGLIATTQNISVDDFMAGKSTFEGTGAAGSVVNQGTLEAALGGYIALLAPSVRNEGVVLAREGTVAFAAGDKTVVQFNGPQLVTVMVDRPVLDALVENKQMVRADGGLVIFSARSANAVLSSVIKNTGTIQAQTIENKNGRILLIGDMQNGSITVDGKLDASAPNQGDGGFIETSAAKVKIADSAIITTLSRSGKTGTWLVDPHDYTVAASNGDQTGMQLSETLRQTNVTLQSASGALTGNGDININDSVSWSANTKLTLIASNNVNVNADITATGPTASLAIYPNTANQNLTNPVENSAGGIFSIGNGASISLRNVSSLPPTSPSNASLVISGESYTIINSLGLQGSVTGRDLQGMNGSGNLNGKYALGSDIDASSTSTWNTGTGFTPIGGGPANGFVSRPPGFSGKLNGLGHSIKDLTINYGADSNYVGMFSLLTGSSSISNLNISNASISGSGRMGLLAGINGGKISNVISSGTVNALTASSGNGWNIGGLVGVNEGSGLISDSSSSANVYGIYENIGGLVGINSARITQSYSTGNIEITFGASNSIGVGGLIGSSVGSASVTNSFSTSSITSYAQENSSFGGLIGKSDDSSINNSYSTGTILILGNANAVGGLVGSFRGGDNRTNIDSSYSKSNILIWGSGSFVGGFSGTTDHANITNSYATGNIDILAETGSINDHIGGFVGNASSSTSIENSYSSGNAGGVTVGGIDNSSIAAGFAGGVELGTTIVNSFWNSQTSGQLNGAMDINRSPVILAGLSVKSTLGMRQLTSASLNDPLIWTQSNNVNNGQPILKANTLYVRKYPGSSSSFSLSTDPNGSIPTGSARGVQTTGSSAIWETINGVLTYSGGLQVSGGDYFSGGDYLFLPSTPSSLQIRPSPLTITANNFGNIRVTPPPSPQMLGRSSTPDVILTMTTPSSSSLRDSTESSTIRAAPVMSFSSSSESNSFGSESGAATISNRNSRTNSTNITNVTSFNNTTTDTAPTSIASASTTNVTNQQTTSRAVVTTNNFNTTTVNVTTTQANVVTPQRLADILSKRDSVEIATELSPNQVSQLSPEQVAPLINALSMRQLMSLTNEQIAKFEPARQAELLNIIKVIKDNPEKAAEKAFTPTDKTFAQLAANGLLKEQIDTLSSRVTQINQNRTTVNIDTPQKLAELLTKKDPVEIATALPSNQVAQLTPEQVAPLISSLTVRQLLALTNEQISKFESARQAELLNIINVIKNNPEKAAEKAYTAIDKTTAQYVANGLMKDQIDALASRVTQITQNKATIPTSPPAIASVALTPKQVSELDPALLAALINQLNANQLMAITNAQMAGMDGRALNQLAILMNFVQQRAANNNGTANGNNPANGGSNTNINVFVNQPVSRLASNALLNEQPKPNSPVGAQSFTQTNITVNLTPKQISELDPTQLAPLISKLNANQLMAITNTQMARMDSQSINQLNILMNFVQQRALNSNTNTTIFINRPVSQIAAASLMNDQPPPTQIAGAAPAPIATVPLSPQQITGLTPSQVAPLLNRMNSRQLMAVTDTQMASLDSANLNQLITLLNFIQDSARTSPIVTNNFANRPVAGFLPPELNTTQTATQP